VQSRCGKWQLQQEQEQKAGTRSKKEKWKRRGGAPFGGVLSLGLWATLMQNARPCAFSLHQLEA